MNENDVNENKGSETIDDVETTSSDAAQESTDWRAIAAAEMDECERSCRADINAALEKHGCRIVPFVELTSEGIGASGVRIRAVDRP